MQASARAQPIAFGYWYGFKPVFIRVETQIIRSRYGINKRIWKRRASRAATESR